jgi:hypothetical protein
VYFSTLEKMRNFKKELYAGCPPANYRDRSLLDASDITVVPQPGIPQAGSRSIHEVMQVGHIFRSRNGRRAETGRNQHIIEFQDFAVYNNCFIVLPPLEYIHSPWHFSPDMPAAIPAFQQGKRYLKIFKWIPEGFVQVGDLQVMRPGIKKGN